MKAYIFFFSILWVANSFGQQANHAATGLDDLETKIELFPNPTSELIFIKNGELIESYAIFDLQGRMVQSGYKNAQVISLVDLPNGYYVFELKVGESLKRIKIQKY